MPSPSSGRPPPGATNCASCWTCWPSAPIAASTRCPGPCPSRCACTAATAAPRSKRPTASQKPGGFGILRDDAPWIHREGVLWHEPSQSDLLFVTLNKSEALFSPSTRYRDLALGPSLFHWESQSTTTAASPTGQRSIHHEARGSRVLLFGSDTGVRGAAPGVSPSRFGVWGLPGTRATRGSGRWRFGGGWSGRYRRGGCRGWRWRFSVSSTPTAQRQAWSALASHRVAATGPPDP